MISFIEKFDENAEVSGDKKLFSYLDGKGKVTDEYTYSEFASKTKILAKILLEDIKIAPGEPVLLVYPPGLDFIVTFIACLRAGKSCIEFFVSSLL